MPYLPQGTTLGRLTVVEVYEYYDIPRFFACQNAAGQRYLALFVDERDDADVWLYVPVSADRLDWVHAGRIEIRSAYQNAESGFVYEMSQDANGDWTERALPCDSVPEERLPRRGEVVQHSSPLPAE